MRLNERTFAEFDELTGGRDWWDTTDLAAVAGHWGSMVERDAQLRVVLLEFQLHAYRNPHLRERPRAFAQANRSAIADYLTTRATEAGRALPVDVDQLAAVFGTSSDGFAQMALVDPDAAEQYGLLLDLVVRGLQSLAGSSTAPGSTSGSDEPDAARGDADERQRCARMNSMRCALSRRDAAGASMPHARGRCIRRGSSATARGRPSGAPPG